MGVDDRIIVSSRNVLSAWPVVRDHFGGGDLTPIETYPDELAKWMDANEGFDFHQRTPGGKGRYLATRCRYKRDDTTIRAKELARWRECLDGGYAMPEYMICFFFSKKHGGTLKRAVGWTLRQYIAMLDRVTEIGENTGKFPAGIQLNVNGYDGNLFWCIPDKAIELYWNKYHGAKPTFYKGKT